MHSGHRERMKQRFRETGFKGFSDVNALELLLFYAVPRQDTNPLAHALLRHFGSFTGVIDAPYDDLIKVPGIGTHVATYIKLIPEVCKRYTQEKQMKKMAYTTPEQLEEFVIPLFSFDMEETLFVICMDSGNRIICCERMCSGDPDSVVIDPKKIIKFVIEKRASRVVLAHNHPSGIAAPSPSDVAMTQNIKQVLECFNIELLDHFIVAEEASVSLRRHGCIF